MDESIHPRKHPAAYSNKFLPLFAERLREAANVLDPMAGSGKIARIKEFGFTGRVVCNELEPEFANGYAVDEWHFGDAERMTWAADESFDAVCTSPTYGNRMADHHPTQPHEIRYTYRHALGHALRAENTGAMQWGEAYRAKHAAVYRECLRVLKPGGLVIVNVSDHIRNGTRVPVADWHRAVLLSLGFALVEDLNVPTPRIRRGANHTARVECERILVFRKEAA